MTTNEYLQQLHAEAFKVLRQIEQLTIYKNDLLGRINKIEADEAEQEKNKPKES